MNNKNISVVFFGTGPVAAASLRNIAEHFSVELVITKPKPSHHRGDWPVEELSRKLGLDVGLCETAKQVEAAIVSKKLKSRAGIIIDFGLIVTKATIDSFDLGIINSHFSLLPKWRGADPISFSILSGEPETGVSLMKIVPKMDEGPLLAQRKISLKDKINSQQLTGELIDLSNQMLLEFLPKYLNGSLDPADQSTEGASYSRKLTKSDGIIDWAKPADTIEREIRAYYQWPRSRTTINQLELIITDAELCQQTGQPGQLKIEDGNLIIFCGQKSLKINRLQPAGKKTMLASEFIRGYENKLNNLRT